MSAVSGRARLAPYDDFDLLVDFGEEEEEDGPEVFDLRAPARAGLAIVPRSRWRDQLAEIDRGLTLASPSHERWPERRQILYSVDVNAGRLSNELHLDLFMRDRKHKGEGFNKMKEFRLLRPQIPELPDPIDREVLSMLTATSAVYSSWSYSGTSDYSPVSSHFRIAAPLSGILIPQICRTERLHLRTGEFDPSTPPIAWDDGPPWELRTEIVETPKKGWAVTGLLVREGERMPLSQPALITKGGLVFTEHSAARLSPDAPFSWIAHLRREPIEAAKDERDLLLASVLEHRKAPRVVLPEGVAYAEESLAPKPRLHIRPVDSHRHSVNLAADLQFEYGGHLVSAGSSGRGVYDVKTQRLLLRDDAAESAAQARLAGLGLKYIKGTYYEPQPYWQIAPKHLPRIVRTLTEEGWMVHAEGKTFRRAVSQRLEISSGIDWFELHGEVDFGTASAQIPDILQALRRGDEMVQLGDGTYGLLPEDWLAKFGPLASLGTDTQDHVRFRRSQAGLLDALLATRPEIRYDETFAQLRDRLREFQSILPAEQPRGFVGHLRDYQREGLGWMDFLRRFGFGGCLADDMGVGKTAQVLALLETRRRLRMDAKAAEKPVGP
jgi:hypothetical protein